MPQLSIITICLNEKNRIEKTISSVIKQKFEDYEFIIIDGKSTDGTADIIRKHKNKIDIFISEKDSGIYNAMNKGIKLSTGKYLLFLNAGDYLYDSQVLYNVFNLKPKAEIIYGNLYLEKEKSILDFKDIKIDKYFFFKKSFPHQASFINKELFIKHGIYNENYKIAGDIEFFIREIIRYKCSIIYIPYIISVYNTEGISANKNFVQLLKNEKIRINKKYYGMSYYYYILYDTLKIIIIDIKHFIKSIPNRIKRALKRIIKIFNLLNIIIQK